MLPVQAVVLQYGCSSSKLIQRRKQPWQNHDSVREAMGRGTLASLSNGSVISPEKSNLEASKGAQVTCSTYVLLQGFAGQRRVRMDSGGQIENDQQRRQVLRDQERLHGGGDS